MLIEILEDAHYFNQISLYSFELHFKLYKNKYIEIGTKIAFSFRKTEKFICCKNTQ